MDPIELAALLRFWKKELELEDWDLEVRIASTTQVSGRHGLVRIQEHKRMALVTLIDPREFNYGEMRPYDLELTLVHELVHVVFPAFIGRREGDHKEITSEQGVHSMSKTLVRLKRRGRRNPDRWIYTRPPK